MKQDIFGLRIEELEVLFSKAGLKRFRARQVFDWVYKKSVFDFARMPNLGKEAVRLLDDRFTILPGRMKVLRESRSRDGLTVKLLLGLPDGNSIETVLMAHDYGYSVCVSSQVGCNMRCAFCASGMDGAVRDLTAAEILAQVYFFNEMLTARQASVSRVVVMGSGEPMLNYDSVLEALDFLHLKEASGLSYRNMTVSTCGIVPGIERLTKEGKPVNLAVSLHSAKDGTRSALMPVNKSFPFPKVIAAAEAYARASGRQVTYEYILIEGVNDSLEDARLLAGLLRSKMASVNLIPANPVAERGFKRPRERETEMFARALRSGGVSATVRREMGKDIDAACGQLRAAFARGQEISYEDSQQDPCRPGQGQ